MKKLGILTLSDLDLKALPEPLLKIKQNKIKSFDISANRLASLKPLSISNWNDLKHLNLSNNKFKQIPVDIFQLQKMETLNLSHNLIVNIPDEISSLMSIKHLNLSHNQLNGLFI